MPSDRQGDGKTDTTRILAHRRDTNFSLAAQNVRGRASPFLTIDFEPKADRSSCESGRTVTSSALVKGRLTPPILTLSRDRGGMSQASGWAATPIANDARLTPTPDRRRVPRIFPESIREHDFINFFNTCAGTYDVQTNMANRYQAGRPRGGRRDGSYVGSPTIGEWSGRSGWARPRAGRGGVGGLPMASMSGLDRENRSGGRGMVLRRESAPI
jgi:hypothetical protein